MFLRTLCMQSRQPRQRNDKKSLAFLRSMPENDRKSVFQTKCFPSKSSLGNIECTFNTTIDRKKLNKGVTSIFAQCTKLKKKFLQSVFLLKTILWAPSMRLDNTGGNVLQIRQNFFFLKARLWMKIYFFSLKCKLFLKTFRWNWRMQIWKHRQKVLSRRPENFCIVLKKWKKIKKN